MVYVVLLELKETVYRGVVESYTLKKWPSQRTP